METVKLTDANEPVSSLPTWAQLALKVMKDHGVTALIAVFLVYFMVTLFAGDIRSMKSDITKHISDTAASTATITTGVEALSADLNRHMTHDDESLHIQRTICVSVALLAKNDQAARDCAK